jgi:uncharacterized membrane protein YcaP (DUF421 family)
MDAVLRSAAIYLVLMLLLRLTGKRTMASVTTFDFVLLLIIGEATQQALLGEDFSLTMAGICIVTLIALDRFSDLLGYHFPKLDRFIESVPLVLVDNGELLHDRLAKVHVSEDDILAHARQSQGLESMSQVKYAVLERDGGISIIPR